MLKVTVAEVQRDVIKQLGIDRQILSQLIDEEAMVAEAEKQGIRISDVEIRERILSLPGFQENGHFVGEQRYRQILQFQNPPMSTAEFERSLLWNDPTLAIEWPLHTCPDAQPLLAAKDAQGLRLQEAPTFS